jgi:hypothetical protein
VVPKKIFQKIAPNIAPKKSGNDRSEKKDSKKRIPKDRAPNALHISLQKKDSKTEAPL